MPLRRPSLSLIAGLSLIALGVLFLVQQLFDISIFGNLWPLFIVAIGAAIFSLMVFGGRPASGLAVPASIVTGIGLILFVLNLTDRWEAWSYAWALILVSVGVGVVVYSRRAGQARDAARGWALVRLGLFLFLLFGAFFELFIFGSDDNAAWAGPGLLILLGVYLLVRNSGIFRRRDSEPTPPAAEVTLEGTAAPADDRNVW